MTLDDEDGILAQNSETEEVRAEFVIAAHNLAYEQIDWSSMPNIYGGTF